MSVLSSIGAFFCGVVNWFTPIPNMSQTNGIVSIDSTANQVYTDTSNNSIEAIAPAMESNSGELPSVSIPTAPLTETVAQAQSLRLITGHTAATLPKGSFELAIQHRFGELGSGAYNLYGLDNFNSMRIGFDYGLIDRVTVGAGRSSYRKTYNAYAKWRFIGKADSKFNLTYLADMSIDGRSRADWNLEPFFVSHRFFYTHQLIASYQIANGLVVSVAPTIVHANLISKSGYSNDIPVLSWYVRQRIIPKFALTAEGSQVVENILNVAPKNHPTVGIGFEYFTPLHVFQINLTNSRALNEPYFMTNDVGSLLLNDFCLGFNLIRRW